jgi:acyl-[acyl-carrier-protein]-phospholipid O-acyltransferase/long-chain-fatty-acid--[acyl-carrier-protein] ligase
MLPAELHPTTSELDRAVNLPARNRVSVTALLIVQALNSFSDNFVKMLVIVFAHAVMKGTPLGDNIQVFLGIILSVPLVLFAPLAGYLSDRHSKQRMVFWMQVAQVVTFAAFLAALALQDAELKMWLSMVMLFALAAQEAFLAPAKMGIMKEIVGSRRLGLASGVQQMSMFAAILAGYAFAGVWFGRQVEAGVDPWHAMEIALKAVIVLTLLQTVGALFVQRTPAHREVQWRRSRWWEHFGNLRLVFKAPAIGLAAIGIILFWFMCNGVGTILVGLCNEAFAVEKVSSEMKGIFSLLLGVGVVLGSLVSSILCRRGIKLDIVPVAIFGLSAFLFLAMTVTAASAAAYLVMTLIGFAAGAFMVPLYSFIQDRAVENERAQVLAGVGVVDCLGGVAANLIVLGLLTAQISSRAQLGIMAAICLGAGLYMTRLRRYRDH